MSATVHKLKAPPLHEALAEYDAEEAVFRRLAEIDAEPWAPQRLPTQAPVLPMYVRTMLPPVLADFVEAVAASKGAAPDGIAGSALACSASLLGGRFAGKPYRYSDWRQPCVIWGGIYGYPGSGKSHAMGAAYEILSEYRDAARREHEAAHREWQAEEKARNLSAHQKARQGAAEAEIQAALQEGKAEPVRRFFILNNATGAAFRGALQHEASLLLACDELADVLEGTKKEHGLQRGELLAAYSGDMSYEVIRKNADSAYMPRPLVSVFGTTQPGKWAEHTTATDGAPQRFSFMVAPDTPLDNEGRELQPLATREAYEKLQQAKARWRAVCDVMRDARPLLEPLPDGGYAVRPKTCNFTGEAEAIFAAWRADNAEHARAAGADEGDAVGMHMRKFPGAIASLATIFALLGQAEAAADTGGALEACEVEAQHVQMALEWVEYLVSHAVRVYGAGELPDTKPARKILAALKAHALAYGVYVDHGELARWCKTMKAERLGAGLAMLQALGWVRFEEVPTAGRSRLRYWVAPELRQATQ